jgi:hypothetical protein
MTVASSTIQMCLLLKTETCAHRNGMLRNETRLKEIGSIADLKHET